MISNKELLWTNWQAIHALPLYKCTTPSPLVDQDKKKKQQVNWRKPPTTQATTPGGKRLHQQQRLHRLKQQSPNRIFKDGEIAFEQLMETTSRKSRLLLKMAYSSWPPDSVSFCTIELYAETLKKLLASVANTKATLDKVIIKFKGKLKMSLILKANIRVKRQNTSNPLKSAIECKLRSAKRNRSRFYV